MAFAHSRGSFCNRFLASERIKKPGTQLTFGGVLRAHDGGELATTTHAGVDTSIVARGVRIPC